jgi:hypothetical protein
MSDNRTEKRIEWLSPSEPATETEKRGREKEAALKKFDENTARNKKREDGLDRFEKEGTQQIKTVGEELLKASVHEDLSTRAVLFNDLILARAHWKEAREIFRNRLGHEDMKPAEPFEDELVDAREAFVAASEAFTRAGEKDAAVELDSAAKTLLGATDKCTSFYKTAVSR